MLEKDSTFARTNQNIIEELFGMSAEQLQTTSALEFIAPRRMDEVKEAIEKVFTEGYYEHETILLDGHHFRHHQPGVGRTAGSNE